MNPEKIICAVFFVVVVENDGDFLFRISGKY